MSTIICQWLFVIGYLLFANDYFAVVHSWLFTCGYLTMIIGKCLLVSDYLLMIIHQFLFTNGCQWLYINVCQYPAFGKMVRGFANGTRDRGSIPGWVIPKTQKWYLMPPCLTLSIIRYVSRVKWSHPGNGVAPSPTPRCSSYWKRSLRVTLDYGRQLYLLTSTYLRMIITWFFICCDFLVVIYQRLLVKCLFVNNYLSVVILQWLLMFICQWLFSSDYLVVTLWVVICQ